MRTDHPPFFPFNVQRWTLDVERFLLTMEGESWLSRMPSRLVRNGPIMSRKGPQWGDFPQWHGVVLAAKGRKGVIRGIAFQGAV